MVNRVVLVGRLTRDPELKYTNNSNIPVATFTLAVNRKFANQQGEREADFINIVVWRKQAENVKNYLGQGSMVAVDGRIQSRSYEADNGRRYVTEIVADSVQFLDTRQPQSSGNNQGYNNQNNNNNYNNNYNNSSYNQQPSFQQNQQQNQSGFNIDNDPFGSMSSSIDISDDDLPF